MKINLKPIDSKEVWEKFWLSHSQQALFQSWEWGDVEKLLGNDIWRFGLYDNEKLTGIAQVVKVKARRGTFMHIRHGPIMENWNDNSWKEMLREINSKLNPEKYWFFRISPLVSQDKILSDKFKKFGLKPAPIHAMDAEICWILDLKIPEAQILSQMRKNTRYAVNQAIRLGVKVTKSQTDADLSKFLNLYRATSLRQKFIPHKGLKEEMAVFAKNDQAQLYLASLDNQLLAGAIILYSGNQAIYHHGASTASKIPASSLILWEAIKEAQKSGKSIFNFWGIALDDNPKHPWQGITLFKQGFGGKTVEYQHAVDWPLDKRYWLTYMIESARKIKKGY